MIRSVWSFHIEVSRQKISRVLSSREGHVIWKSPISNGDKKPAFQFSLLCPLWHFHLLSNDCASKHGFLSKMQQYSPTNYECFLENEYIVIYTHNENIFEKVHFLLYWVVYISLGLTSSFLRHTAQRTVNDLLSLAFLVALFCLKKFWKHLNSKKFLFTDKNCIGLLPTVCLRECSL